MNIIGTQYNVKYRCFEIYTAGCKGYCPDCHNKDTWDFNQGKEYHTQMGKICDKLKDFSEVIDYVWILGGEPLDNDRKELIDLMRHIRGAGKKIVLFTSKNLEEVDGPIKKLCEYIKCGKYLPEQKGEKIVHGITLSTLNQTVYKKGEDYD